MAVPVTRGGVTSISDVQCQTCAMMMWRERVPSVTGNDGKNNSNRETKGDDDEEEYRLPDRLAWEEKEDNAYDEHLVKELCQDTSANLSLSGSTGSSCMMKDANGFWIPSLFDDIEAEYIHSHGPGYHKIVSPTPLPPTPEIPFEFPKVLGKAVAEQEDEEEQEGEEKEEEEEEEEAKEKEEEEEEKEEEED
ncbi:hypothetical protein GYMLUDRAFT_250245 [Collybiopsis luxurians FD-317 M1]|uniref:Uncharacterized protein n=1 Tax=Collybiopsis luxurians FD-317 M1 TaxID=944289 RepID=A0A0D0C6Z3_9AGAR|nr:hypothetical protein GYMLUDRAFT_250245 [Collybiopsis luxurians FD-317 M1]